MAIDFVSPETLESLRSFNSRQQNAFEQLKPPMQPPMPQQPMPQQPQGLLGRIGAGIKRSVQDPNFMDRLTIGLGGMSMRPNEALMGLAQNRIEQRQKLGMLNEQKNRTIEALKRLNTPEAMRALQLLDAGGSISDALTMGFEKSEEKGRVVDSTELRRMYPNIKIEDGLYNLKGDGTMTRVGGGGVTVNTGDTGAQDFTEQRVKASLPRYTAMQEQASLARSFGSQIDLLEDLLKDSARQGSGFANFLSQRLADNLGIDLRSDSQIAAEAMLSRLIPAQREKGSGPMSDRDLDMFRNALPSLKATESGNMLITGTLRAIAQYQDQLGKIVDDVYNEFTDPRQVMDEIEKRQRALVNPLEDFRTGLWKNKLTKGAGGVTVLSIEQVS